PKPMTGRPAAFIALALLSTASVADSEIAEIRAEMRGRVMPPSFQIRCMVSPPYPVVQWACCGTVEGYGGDLRAMLWAGDRSVWTAGFDVAAIHPYTSPFSGPREERAEASGRFSGYCGARLRAL